MKRILSIMVALLTASHTYSQEAVDLGLSVKWGDRNIGASSPYEKGELFAWGEVEPKSKIYDYTWENYFDVKNLIKRYSMYFPTFKEFHQNGYKGFAGVSENDVAKKRLGGKWRMPKRKDFQELFRNCTVNYCYDKARNQYYFEVVADNGNSIIIPYTGRGGYPGDNDKGCYLWSATLSDEDTEAYAADFSPNYKIYGGKLMDIVKMWRCLGFAVRPVQEIDK